MAKRGITRKTPGKSGVRTLRTVKTFPFFATWKSWLPQGLLITLVTFWIYWPALSGDFVWDDGWYITTNSLLRNADGLWKFWFQPGSWVDYYPLEETVLWIFWHLWGNDTLGYHVTNVGLHIVNALLVWRLLAKFDLPWAWLGGLVFAVHPVQVDTAAYVSELKNTFSLPFFLLAMCWWIDYSQSGKRRDYLWALFMFLLAMLGKITMAPFPVAILLYAWWRTGRVTWNDLRGSVPFFAIALGLGFMTFVAGELYVGDNHAQHDRIFLGDPLTRFVGAGLIVSAYFSRCFLPIDSYLRYPLWTVDDHSPIEYLPWLLIVGVFFWLWQKRATWGRHILLGMGFFLITLGPFLGFKAISYMSFTWIMDHLLYIPLIGPIGLLVAALGDLAARFPSHRSYVTGTVAILIALMAAESHALAGLFINDETLWVYTLQTNPHNLMAQHDLGCDLLDGDHPTEAIPHFQEVIRLQPDSADGHCNLGLCFDKLGRHSEAEEQYQLAMRYNPGDTKIYIDMAGSLLQSDRAADAIAFYEQAVKINPDLAQLRYDLGSALLRSGRLPEAIEQLRAAVALQPHLAQAQENLGSALAQSGAVDEAIGHFELAVSLDPSYVVARNNLGLALAQKGHLAEAVEQFEQVLQIDPDNVTARSRLDQIRALQNRSRK